MKTYSIYLKSINEELFGWGKKKEIQPDVTKTLPVTKSEPKKFQIQREYQEPEIENEKVQQVIDEYNNAKKLCIKYMTLFKSTIYSSSERDSYYEKTLSNFVRAVTLLYKITIVKDKYNVTNIDIEKEFNFLANYYTFRKIPNTSRNKPLYDLLGKATFFLNEMYQYLYNDFDYEDPQFNHQIIDDNKRVKFVWKRKSDLARKGTEQIDPFQEEEWG